MDRPGIAPRPAEPPAPPQERGRQRRDEIVRAASRLVDRAGYRRVTVRGVAAESGTSPATIYHYFPDLDAVVAAVAADYLERVTTAVGAVLDRDEPSVERFVAAVTEAFRSVFARHPGLRELWFSRRASPKVVALHAHYRDLLAETMRHKAAGYRPDAGGRPRHRALMEAHGALWELAFALDPEGDPRVVDAMRVRITRRFGGTPVPAVPRGSGAPGVAALRAALETGPRPWAAPPPRQQRSRERREAILRAARDLLDEHGPHDERVTVRAIADRAGVPPASLHQYFGDVAGLAAAVAVGYGDELLDVLDRTYLRPGPGAGGRARAFVDACRAHLAAHPGLRDLWFDHHASEAVAAVHRHHQLTVAGLLGDTGNTADTGDAVSPEDPLDELMLVTQLDALWDFAFLLDPAGDDVVTDEITGLLRERDRAPVTPSGTARGG